MTSEAVELIETLEYLQDNYPSRNHQETAKILLDDADVQRALWQQVDDWWMHRMNLLQILDYEPSARIDDFDRFRWKLKQFVKGLKQVDFSSQG